VLSVVSVESYNDECYRGASNSRCKDRTYTVTDIQTHFQNNADLYFLFGINVYRPYMNALQEKGEASVLVFGLCKPNSSDCVPYRGNLSERYQLEFTVADFLYKPFMSTGWYEPEIWHQLIWINNSNTGTWTKWIEIPQSFFEGSGVQHIQGSVKYNGYIQQEFKLDFYVRMYDCLIPPLLTFDGIINQRDSGLQKIHLKALHFKYDPTGCRINEFKCKLNTYRLFENNATIDLETEKSLSTIFSKFYHDPTANTDKIYESQITEQEFIGPFIQIRENVSCLNEKEITSKKFTVCSQNCIRGQRKLAMSMPISIFWLRIDPVTNTPIFTQYNDSAQDPRVTLIPVNLVPWQYIVYVPAPPEPLPRAVALKPMIDDYYQIIKHQLTIVGINGHFFDITHMISGTIVEVNLFYSDYYPFRRKYKIITDRESMCTLICRKYCFELSPTLFLIYGNYSTHKQTLFCPHCFFSIMETTTNSIPVAPFFFGNMSVLTHFIQWNLSSFMNKVVRANIPCINATYNSSLNIELHIIEHKSPDILDCSLATSTVRSYHDLLGVSCLSSYVNADVIIWALTKLGSQLDKLSTQSVILPQGDELNGNTIILEVNLPQMDATYTLYALTTNPDNRMIEKINSAVMWNYFFDAYQLIESWLKMYKSEFYRFYEDDDRIKFSSLTPTTFLLSFIDYCRLILRYLKDQRLYQRTQDFAETTYSFITQNIKQLELMYQDEIVFQRYILLLIDLTKQPELIVYDGYHFLRHITKFLTYRLPQKSIHFLEQLLLLIENLHTFIAYSMPVPNTTDANSLVELGLILNNLTTVIHDEFVAQNYAKSHRGAFFELLLDVQAPFITQRWALFLNRQKTSIYSAKQGLSDDKIYRRDKRQTTVTSLDLIYHPQEYVPYYSNSFKNVNHVVGQLISIIKPNSTLSIPILIQYSLTQPYLYKPTVSTIKYLYKMTLSKMNKNFYRHNFAFQMNTTALTKNLTLLFYDLPNSIYHIELGLVYNSSCSNANIIDRLQLLTYTFDGDLTERNFFVQSLPVESNSLVCAQVRVVSQKLRGKNRLATFMVLETACYSFQTKISEEYFNSFEQTCQLHNEDFMLTIFTNESFNGPRLECYCSKLSNYFILNNLMQLNVQFEVLEQIWIRYFIYILIILLIYLLLAIYAIHADVLEEYPIYFYQLSIFTGLQQSASSDAKIFVRLIGQNRIDIAHCLNLDDQYTFQRGAVDQFLITSFIDLGPLRAINFWENEMGKHSDWYIRHCIVYDYQRQHSSYFCCYAWLSSYKGDSVINDVFYQAQEVDMHSFGHLFVSTFSWLFYHYHLFNSIFFKQKPSTFPRMGRLHLYFFLLLLQLFLTMITITVCKKKQDLNPNSKTIFPFLFIVNQSFIAESKRFYYMLTINFIPCLSLALLLSLCIVIITPFFIWFYEFITFKWILYEQMDGAHDDLKSFDNLHSTFFALVSIQADIVDYQSDTEQFSFVHKFDLKHRLSISSTDINQQIRATGKTTEMKTKLMDDKNTHVFTTTARNLNQFNVIGRKYQREKCEINANSVSSPLPNISTQESWHSNISTTMPENESILEYDWSNLKSAIVHPNAHLTLTKLLVKFKLPEKPSRNIYLFSRLVYFGSMGLLTSFSFYFMFATLETFTQTDNYFVTANGWLFHITDEFYFLAHVVEIPTTSLIDIAQQKSNVSSGLSRDIILTRKQLQTRIRERILESSIIRAMIDVLGYIVFFVIIILIFMETKQNEVKTYLLLNAFRSQHIQTRLALKQYTFQLLLREGVFQGTEEIHEEHLGLDWVRYFLENRLFVKLDDYTCSKEECNYVPIPDSPLYLSKSVRILQIRVNRQECRKKIIKLFREGIKFCFVDAHDLMSKSSLVISDSMNCTAWTILTVCAGVCPNEISLWQPVPYKHITKLYSTYESPYYYIFYLLPKETVLTCSRKRRYYELWDDKWLDNRSIVFTVEGNLYSPQANSLITFVLTLVKDLYGTVTKEILIEVSDYSLSADDVSLETINTTILPTNSVINNNLIRQPVLTNYLFAALLVVIFAIKLFALGKYTRNFGFTGFISFIRTLANLIDILLLLLCCYYFLFFYLDNEVLQVNSILKNLDVQRLYVSFRTIIINNEIVNVLIGSICMVAILKLLNLLKFNPKTFLLAETIKISLNGFCYILSFCFLNYFLFAIIARLLFPTDIHFKTVFVAFRVVLVTSIKDSSTQSIDTTVVRAIWQFLL
ncbi:unnamed protein product, partial [Didymodactylos carnosus]